MKKTIAVLICAFLLSGCSSYSAYDEGYEDGYDGRRKKVQIFNAAEYSNGYADGREDGYYFDLGYKDGNDGEAPQYPSNSIYMQGYREGEY